VPSYQSPEAAVRALARACEYAAWRAVPEGDIVVPEDVDLERGLALMDRILQESPGGRELSHEELAELLAAYGIELWERVPVTTEAEALAAGARFGWDVILKATAEHLRQRPDLAHVWRNIDNAEEMSDAWQTMRALIDSPDNAGFIVQRNAPPGVPVTVRGVEDPLFGPVVSFGVSGPATELLGDRSYRIPPLHAGDAASMVREVKAAPLLFGYRGSELVAIEPIENLLIRLAQLKNDLPQVRSLDLSLVLAGATRSTVLTASARVEPVADARSDWFVRRLTEQAGDTFVS
jgi:acyl-CoA synthetase (NDP forming)